MDKSWGFTPVSGKENAVYDVDFKDIENLNTGKYPPRWKCFYDFMEDFISGKDVEGCYRHPEK